MVHEVVSVIDSVPVTKQRPPPPGVCVQCAPHPHTHVWTPCIDSVAQTLHPVASMYPADICLLIAVELLENTLGDAGQPRANCAATVDKPEGNPNRCVCTCNLQVTGS